jgi:predicted amidohydrolase
MQGAAAFNQYHVVYVNRPGPVFSGGSAVYDPRGEQVAALGGGMEVRDVEIDLTSADLWRKQEAIFPNRRPLLYRRVASRQKSLGLRRKKKRLKLAG